MHLIGSDMIQMKLENCIKGASMNRIYKAIIIALLGIILSIVAIMLSCVGHDSLASGMLLAIAAIVTITTRG